MNKEEFDNHAYYGSNSWLVDFRDHLNLLIERRKTQKYELFFRITYIDNHPHEHKHICYIEDINEIRSNAKKIIDLPDEYKELKAFIRRLEDNYIWLIAKKTKGQLLEITENFFKI